MYVAFASPATGGPDFAGTLTVTSPSPTPRDPHPDCAGGGPAPGGFGPRHRPLGQHVRADRCARRAEGRPGDPGGRPLRGILKDNDRIGLVRFNQNAANPGTCCRPSSQAGDPASGAGRAAIRAALTTTNLAPTGSTSIGGGTILGSNVLDAAVATARAVIVLTDGIQNTAPDIPAARSAVAAKSPRQRVFAIGLGLNQLEDSLIQLASVSNGTAHITGELAADREFLLQKLYVQILSDVADEAFVEDPVELIYPGTSRATDIWIGEVDVAVTSSSATASSLHIPP